MHFWFPLLVLFFFVLYHPGCSECHCNQCWRVAVLVGVEAVLWNARLIRRLGGGQTWTPIPGSSSSFLVHSTAVIGGWAVGGSHLITASMKTLWAKLRIFPGQQTWPSVQMRRPGVGGIDWGAQQNLWLLLGRRNAEAEIWTTSTRTHVRSPNNNSESIFQQPKILKNK